MLLLPTCGNLPTQSNVRPIPRPQADLQPRTAEDKLRQLAIVHSHPTWMVASWVAQYGAPAAVELMQHNNRRPAYGLRVNLDRVPSVPAFLEHLESKYGGEVQVVASHYLPTDFVQIRCVFRFVLWDAFVLPSIGRYWCACADH